MARKWLTCLCMLACCACSFSDRHEACVEASDCGGDQVCFKGFCVRSDEASEQKIEPVMIADAGARAQSKPRADAAAADSRRSPEGTGGSAADPASVPEVADAGAPSRRPGGAAAGGGGGSSSATDGEGSHADAAVSSMSMMSGSAMSSAGTHAAACEPRAEQCNGGDDDCDGQIDEYTDTDCYPDGRAGCTRDAAGRWACTGTCATGKRACVDGKLQNCEQFKAPSPEVCTELGMQAADEDCNGATDETCACTSGAVSSCYDGRAGTRDVGQCKSGTQTCTDGKLGPCTGQVTPTAEQCNGVDDDCNDKIDEGFNLKHDQNNCGECGHKCAGDELCKQGECTAQKMGQSDPPPSEPPPSEPPPSEPKGCSPACGSGQTCCGKTCVDVNSDANNCGMCGNACVGATKPGCCGGKCVDLVSNQHCGRCGHDCSLLGNGGITCSCGMSGNGEIACTGPVLNLCL